MHMQMDTCRGRPVYLSALLAAALSTETED